ncbi:MAG: hypothetical protein K2X39_09595, partial [Silvanigrellaceae bacterium]|nr:hypothetical protein [Silvanigrellaceae bacterium]
MSKKKEILVVYILTKLELGGAQKVCLSLFNGFKNLDDFSSFLISSTDGILVDQVKNLSSVCLLKSLKRELSLKSIFTEIGAFWDLFIELKRIKKDNPDLQIIVHTHSTKAGILGRWAALFAGIKNRIHTIHGYAFHKHQSYLSW